MFSVVAKKTEEQKVSEELARTKTRVSIIRQIKTDVTRMISPPTNVLSFRPPEKQQPLSLRTP